MRTALSIAVVYALLTLTLGQPPTDAVLRLNKGVLSDGELTCPNQPPSLSFLL